MRMNKIAACFMHHKVKKENFSPLCEHFLGSKASFVCEKLLPLTLTRINISNLYLCQKLLRELRDSKKEGKNKNHKKKKNKV